jgi:predicted metal-dependent enzyme (double-stranded beta helix superfamily)
MSQATPESRRADAVRTTLAAVRSELATGTPDRAALARIAVLLDGLAQRPELFPSATFLPPAESEGVGASTRYRLNPADGDDDIALYLNSINPGKTTVPHNHDTWAVIVAIEGDELNRLYRRTDDGRDPAHAQLVLDREFTVKPGQSIQFLAQDIHSIHVGGTRPTLHFHLYGRPLETLTGRVGFDLATGAVTNYNATQMKPSKVVA